MSSQTIRLRLVIRRHSVPEVKLVWPCIANDDLTVSKFLALVNEVVPLESPDWGLEDYVVELADGKGDSFELLHFQPVGKVLKEDDQVLIRSLSTDDLRRRRLNGRHQISLDGKHLIDGLAFGRPWLRAPRDRPALDLPPRKRARITHEEELEEEEDSDEEYSSTNEDEYSGTDGEEPSKQLLLEDTPPADGQDEPGSVRLRARFIDTDQLGEDDDEELDVDTDFQPTKDGQAELENDDDGDSEPSDEDEDEPDDDLVDELKFLQQDNALIEQVPGKEQQNSPKNNRQEAQTPSSAPKFDLAMVDKITALRVAFPFTSLSTMHDILQQNDNDLKKTFQVLGTTNSPTITFDEVLEIALLGVVFNTSQPSPKQPAEQHNPEEEEEDEELETPTLRLPGQSEATGSKRPLIQVVDNEESPSSAPGEAMGGTAKRLISVVDEDDDTSSSSDSSDSDSDSDSDEDSYNGPDKDSDSDSDSSDSEDEPMGEADDPTRHSTGDASSSDISDSESDSDSDSDLSFDLSKTTGGAKISLAQDSDDSSDSSSDSDSSSSDSDSESEPEELSSKKQSQAKQSPTPTVPETKTESQAPKSVPERTEDSKPPGAGLTRTKKRNARRRDHKRLKAMQALEDTQSQQSTNKAPSEDAEFLARKRALLSVVSDESGNVPSPPKETPATGPTPMIVEVETEEASAPTTQDAASTEESAPQRRHKVDMGAGRRMLFGALGLKNPKSKADEDKLRNSLMKDVKPLQNPRVQVEEPKADEAESTADQEDEDPEAWRKRISYRAVECCQENITLSEPPFPFVQRWDPQQQYTSVRKRKRASQEFNDDSYYGEEWNSDQEWQDDTQTKKKKKSKKRKGKGGQTGGYDGGYEEMETTEYSYAETGVDGDEDVVLNYDDIPTMTSKPRLQDTQFTEMDDLPSLPSDLTTLPSLQLSETKPGMVITWKQLLMSKATKWQPEMVSTTGLILSISDDNCLNVLLAKRDRDEDDKEYDHHTGQRVYGKFEVPDFDEDEDNDEEDNGQREIAWEEMSDPRLVQPAPAADSSETLAKGTELPTEPTKPVQDGTANTKVSTRTHPDETMAEELDTQKVRAEIEADLKDREAADKPSGTDIPSGQQPPRLEFSGENSPISSFIRPPMETPSDVTNSPTRQLRETMESVAREDNVLSCDSEERSNVEERRANAADEMDGVNDAKDLDEPMPTVEAGWDTIVPDSIPLPELPALPTKDDIPMDNRLAVPSSVGSVRSGRQPPSISGLEDLPEERVEDSIVDNDKRATSPQNSIVSVRSSSAFPSLEELFQTARQTQSPMKFSQPSAPQHLKTEKHDAEYEEAMRKLDEGEDETDRSYLHNKSLRSLLSHAPRENSPLQRSIKIEASQTKAVEAEQFTPPPSQKVKQESQAMVEEGGQVIELSLTPPSVQYTEHYVQDSEDETYHESPLPQGEGWVQKNYSEMKTRSRGKSPPATTAATTEINKTTTTTQSRTARGRTCLPPVRDATASAYSQIRGRRKLTRKF